MALGSVQAAGKESRGPQVWADSLDSPLHLRRISTIKVLEPKERFPDSLIRDNISFSDTNEIFIFQDICIYNIFYEIDSLWLFGIMLTFLLILMKIIIRKSWVEDGMGWEVRKKVQERGDMYFYGFIHVDIMQKPTQNWKPLSSDLK